MDRAVIYARISLDRDEVSASPETQVKNCAKYAKDMGWEVIGEPFVDSNISAYRKGVKRLAYDAALDAVRSGAANVILIWKLDRIHRQLGNYIQLEQELDSLGAALCSVVENFDSRIKASRMAGRIVAVFADEESTNTGIRVKAAQQRSAEQGRPHGGGSRIYGYDRERDSRGRVVPGSPLVVVPGEAEIIRQMVTELLAGSSLYAVAKRLNEEGVVTSREKPWTAGSISQLLKSPVLANKRRHHGILYEGTWEPILDENTRLRIEARLKQNRNGRVTNATSLLTGIAHCGVCGKRMNKANSSSSGKIFYKYACNRNPGLLGCGGVTISLAPTDALITELVLHHLEQPRQRDGSPEERLRKVEDALEAAVAAQSRLMRLYVDGMFSNYDDFLAQHEEIANRIESLEVERAPLLRGAERLIELPGAVRSWWGGAELADKRLLLASQFADIRILPARRKGGNQYDPDRVTWTWRE